MSDAPPPGRGSVAAGLDLGAAIGGPRGIVESSVPGALFVLVYAVRHSLAAALVVSVASALVLVAVRLARRETVQHAVSGLLGIGIGALIAWVTGSARNFYFPSLVRNPALAVAYAVSVAVRWPVVGIFAGAVLGESPAEWRADPARMRAYVRATWLWVAMFALRFAIQLPLYLSDRVDALGAVNVVLGLPLYGLVLLATWAIVRKPREELDAGLPGSEPLDAGRPGTEP
ncbi:uncharacterized protein DUF3159 [Motilibacter peucedani]|uniref:Uncharacterized protein DUF3159 n=1 Tax=Motilibacter peucedani TaxID=598650 RepID=A0A420XRY9_9ACTN|nr:DUF3159 domain-containing protein [Motilibacter peucedani]RKS77634.1 uncharacterized protein DUF3159 [Motilibacter peucedani]